MATHTSSAPAAIPRGAFRQMGWAFLFLGVSIGPTFRLGQDQFVLDVLPDFVGFLMIAAAANRLVRFLPQARPVRNLAIVLTYLAIPTILQYSVVTSQGENISTWKSPLWPLMIVETILELGLVWHLCGMVASLARQVGDAATEQKAYSRRAMYIGLKILLSVGLAVVMVSPNPNLIVGGVIGGLVIGVTLLALMMGLMFRAERICEQRPEIDLFEPNARRGGTAFRILSTFAVLLPIILAGLAYYYHRNWQDLRDEEHRRASSSDYFMHARTEFYEHLRAGRIDEAYEVTSAEFKKRVSRQQFGERARRYEEYRALREKGGGATGAGMSSSGESLTSYEYIQMDEGKILQVTISLRPGRDSILLRTPPPVKVDDFHVEEKASQAVWPRGPVR